MHVPTGTHEYLTLRTICIIRTKGGCGRLIPARRRGHGGRSRSLTPGRAQRNRVRAEA